MRKPAALVLMTLFASQGASGEQDPAHPRTTSEISVTAVEIPVEVVKGDEPVKGLTAADFEVWDTDRKRSLTVTGLETIDLAAPDRAETPPPPAARRHLLLFFDLALTHPQRVARGVAAARELVATGLDPRDLVGVAFYLPSGDLHLALSFTTDRGAAERTLTALEHGLTGKEDTVKTAAAHKPDPLLLTGVDARTLISDALRAAQGNFAGEMLASLGPTDGTMGSFLQHNVLAHSSIVDQASVAGEKRAQVQALADGMTSLSESLRSVVGRKYLVLFSQGFPIALATGGDQRVDGPSTDGSPLLTHLEKTVGLLRRSGWVLHAAAMGYARLNADGLFFLAKETGGSLVEGTNKLAQGLGDTLRTSEHAYLLTVQTDELVWDGSYHPVEVRLRSAPRGVRVRHRGGFYAPLPFSRQTGPQRLAEAAQLVASTEERDDLGIAVAAVPLRAGAAQVPVALVVEVPGPSLSGSAAGKLELDLYAYAFDDQGAHSGFFAQTIALDAAGVGLARRGVRVFGRLDLPADRQRLRVLVRQRDNGRLSLRTVPLNLTSAGAATESARIDAVFLPAADDGWLAVRPAEAPITLHGRALLPAVRVTVPAGGQAPVVIFGRGFGEKGSWVSGRILTAAGTPAAGGELELLTLNAGEAGEPDLVIASLHAGSLAPGDYRLELLLGGANNALKSVTERSFTVAR